jgi:hypothetical protein
MQYRNWSAQTSFTPSGAPPAYVPVVRWLNSSAVAAAWRIAVGAFSVVWKVWRAHVIPKIAAAQRIPTRPIVLIIRHVSAATDRMVIIPLREVSFPAWLRAFWLGFEASVDVQHRISWRLTFKRSVF